MGVERITSAFRSLLSMAASLVVTGVFDVLGLFGVATGTVPLAVDLALRGVGLVLFAALLARNRRESEATQRADAKHSA
ncbi:hypothetical protein ABSL23_08860 [Halobacterium sp. NMX12-1]|uniref:DUF378 domain-containing protein n=1 Tax=Halobacterium sp. NMX12-1 TaxID=3166650 RepID=A0AAU8CAS5_9EURY